MIGGVRSRKRALLIQIKKYLVENQELCSKRLKINIPENIKSMRRAQFEAWVDEMPRTHLSSKLADLLQDYDQAKKEIISVIMAPV